MDITTIVEIISAVGALGTAATGLVDTTKLFGGGVSNAGYATIKQQLKPFDPLLSALHGASGVEILDSKNEGASASSCHYPRRECGPSAAEMQVAGGRGGEPGPDRHGAALGTVPPRTRKTRRAFCTCSRFSA